MKKLILSIAIFFIFTSFNTKKEELNCLQAVNLTSEKEIDIATLIHNKEKELGLNYNSLYNTIKTESNFNSYAYNKKTRALGLLQFLPKTYKWLGYTKKQLLTMSAEQQLNTIVTRYLMGIKRIYPIKTELDIRLAGFYPYALKHKNNDKYIIGSEKSESWSRQIAVNNKGFDLNKDGYITIGEIKKYINN